MVVVVVMVVVAGLIGTMGKMAVGGLWWLGFGWEGGLLMGERFGSLQCGLGLLGC